MATVLTEPVPGRVVLHDVSWDFYERFLQETRGQRLKHVYDEGELTIVSPLSLPHESPKKAIAQLVEMLTLELGIPRRSIGSLTLKSSALLKGAEPDEGYFIANEPAMRGRDQYDPEVDPPPDLLIEIDVTNLSRQRLPVYAALGVPEVWVWDGSGLHVNLLTDEGTFEASDASRAFPFLPIAEFAAWITRPKETDETTWIRSFREWVREGLALP